MALAMEKSANYWDKEEGEGHRDRHDPEDSN